MIFFIFYFTEPVVKGSYTKPFFHLLQAQTNVSFVPKKEKEGR